MPKIFNNTDLSLEDIRKLPLLKIVRNEWRMREVRLYQHPEHKDRVVSFGEDFDGSKIVIADESKEDFDRELGSASFFVTTH